MEMFYIMTLVKTALTVYIFIKMQTDILNF